MKEYVDLVESVNEQDNKIVDSVLELNKKLKSKKVEVQFSRYDARNKTHDFIVRTGPSGTLHGRIEWNGKEFELAKGGMSGNDTDLGKFKKPADMLKPLLAMANDKTFKMPSWGTSGT
jgi:hypothetical protein